MVFSFCINTAKSKTLLWKYFSGKELRADAEKHLFLQGLFEYVLFILIFSLFLFQVHAEIEPDQDQYTKTELKNLKSKDPEVWQLAQTKLRAGGKKTFHYIISNFGSFSSTQRRRLIKIIAENKTAEADILLVNMAISDPNYKIRNMTTKAISKRLTNKCRKQLINKTKVDSPEIKKRAIAIIKKMKDPVLIKALIRDLERELQHVLENEMEAQYTVRNVTMDINLSQRDFAGYTRYPTMTKMNGPNGPIYVRNDIRMPRFSSRSVITRATLPAAKTLKLVTGRNYRNDIDKWKKWYKQQKWE